MERRERYDCQVNTAVIDQGVVFSLVEIGYAACLAEVEFGYCYTDDQNVEDCKEEAKDLVCRKYP